MAISTSVPATSAQSSTDLTDLADDELRSEYWAAYEAQADAHARLETVRYNPDAFDRDGADEINQAIWTAGKRYQRAKHEVEHRGIPLTLPER